MGYQVPVICSRIGNIQLWSRIASGHQALREVTCLLKEFDLLIIVFTGESHIHVIRVEIRYKFIEFLRSTGPCIENVIHESLVAVPSLRYLRHLLVFIYAIEEINNSTELLPNTTLGYHIYDSCTSEVIGLKSLLSILSEEEKPTPNYKCKNSQKLVAVIGHLLTSTTNMISDIVQVLGYAQPGGQPQVNSADPDQYGQGTCDHGQRPEVPSEYSHITALIQLLIHFGWTWVGVITTEDKNYESNEYLKHEFNKNGICIAFNILVTQTIEQKDLIIQQDTSNVWICALSSNIFDYLMNLCEKSDKEICSEAMLINRLQDRIEDELTTFHITYSTYVAVYAVANVITKLQLTRSAFHWNNWSPSTRYKFKNLLRRTFLPLKSGENVSFDDKGDVPGNFDIMNAVIYANNTVRKKPVGTYLSGSRSPFNINDNLISWNPVFNGNGKHRMFPHGMNFVLQIWHIRVMHQEILHYQVQHMRQARNVCQASYDQSRYHNLPVVAHHLAGLQVQQQQPLTPTSVCSKPCPVGYRKAVKSGMKQCCFDCVSCSEGEMSNKSDSDTCIQCHPDHYSNPTRDKCIKRQLDFLSYEDYLGATMASLSVTLMVTTIAVFYVFFNNRNAPIVKANNCNLSYILLVSLKLSFLCSLLFIGRPTDITCHLRQMVFLVIFSVAISSLLGKTLIVIAAFNSTKPHDNWRFFMNSTFSFGLIIACTLGEFLICIIWSIWAPPFADYDTRSVKEKLILKCNDGSTHAFYIAISYIGLFAVFCYTVAFSARKLPDSFNEARNITFSMLIFCSVWITFIPSYMSTKGKDVVAVEIFAILSSAGGLLCSIFFPKCYILLIKPTSKLSLLEVLVLSIVLVCGKTMMSIMFNLKSDFGDPEEDKNL
ncbi:vomeronasal type-2 receptor 26-like [Dendropsophus ebraccatus]|uniref:vomeronasal type-2 receptor 26-like n=1 Tax=Dendropsophus ebraccatus TaxID=150705 RepID=UPI0038311068